MTTNKTSRDGSELCKGLGPLPDGDWTPGATLQFSAVQMRAYAAQAVAAERERCAKIADEHARRNYPWGSENTDRHHAQADWAERIAAVIRGPRLDGGVRPVTGAR